MSKICNNCGFKLNDNDSFCVNCGEKVSESSEKYPCPECGKLINFENNFCIYCGKEIRKLSEREKNYRKKLSKLKKNPPINICMNCNNTTNNEICEVCGTNQSKFCPDCGTNLNEKEKFCINCGKEIENNITYFYCPNCLTKQEQLYIKNQENGSKKVTPHCMSCGTLIEKSLTDKEYDNLYKNNILNPLINYYNLSNEKPIAKQLGLSFNQMKHIEAILIRSLLYGNINKENLIESFEYLKNEVINTESTINEKILELSKIALKSQFEQIGFKTTIKFGGKDKKVMVSEAHYETVQIPVTESKHGGDTRLLATALLGVGGYALTSGVKTKYKTEQVYKPAVYTTEKTPITLINININKTNIFYEVVTEEKTDKRTIKWEFIDSLNNEEIILKDGSVISDIPLPDFSHIIIQTVNQLRGTYLTKINETLYAQYDNEENKQELRKYYEFIINNEINNSKNNLIENNTISQADELLKWHNLYKEGIISQEEFEKKKKELIG